MTGPLKRAYTGKDVDMLTACGTIIEQAINHKTFLISKRVVWADPYFANLKMQIDNAFTNFLGIDNAKEMRQATQIVLSIQTVALLELSEFKVQIMADFKSNKAKRDEILNSLGFTTHYKEAQKKDQEALIELLQKFQLNMTGTLQAEITSAGTPLSLINAIIGHANVLKTANINQETFKGSRKVITETAVTEFNTIYNQVISIATISANFYKNDTAMKDKFSYTKTLKNLNHPKPVPPKNS